MTLGIIPARGGSKGVPRKNIREIAGKPLIAFTIEQALQSRSIKTVVVSTDDADIADVSRAYGAEVLLRPESLAQDDSPVINAVEHVANHYQNFSNFALLQPTSPLRTAEDIDSCVDLFNRFGKTVCSVVKVEDAHPARMYRLHENPDFAVITSLQPELADTRRQDLPPYYHRNGCVYVFSSRAVEVGRIIEDQMIPYVMPAERSLNIDSQLDFLVLKTLVEAGDML